MGRPKMHAASAVRFNVILSREQSAKLRRIARSNGMTAAQVVRAWIDKTHAQGKVAR